MLVVGKLDSLPSVLFPRATTQRKCIVTTPSTVTILVSKDRNGQKRYALGERNGHLERPQAFCNAYHKKIWQSLESVVV